MKTTCVLFYLLISNLFLNIFSLNLYAQKADLCFQHFGVEQGMSSESIASIYQDNRGYMWFLTYNGVDRYDGYNFKTFKYPKKDKIVPSLFNNTICEDKDGIFWVASLNGGIEKFDPVNGTFHNYLPDPKNQANDWSNTVISICIDKYEAVWIGSGDGLYKFNKKTESFTAFKHDKNDTFSLAHNSVNCIYEDKEGKLWIGTGAGLDRFDRQTNKFLHYWNYPDNYWGNLKGSCYWILSFAEDSNNILWI